MRVRRPVDRRAFGRNLIEHPLMRRQLMKIMVPTEQALSFTAYTADLARSFRPIHWILQSFSLFTAVSLIAVAAIVRHRVLRRRRLRAMEDEESPFPPEWQSEG